MAVPSEGQTMGFAGGRASEIDIRAEFKRSRMLLQEKNLLAELGMEQELRKTEAEGVTKQLGYLADDFELQQKVSDKITEMEDAVFDAAKDLRTEAKDTLGMILDSMKGVNPDEMPAQTRAQLQTLAAQSGLPLELITSGLKVQYQRQVFEDSIDKAKLALDQAQERRLASESGGGGKESVTEKTQKENNKAAVSLHGSTILEAMKSGASPEDAVRAAAAIADATGETLNLQEQQALLKFAREQTKKEAENKSVDFSKVKMVDSIQGFLFK